MADSDEQAASEPTIVECSADGTLLIEVDYSGEQVRVQLEPEAATWPMEVLADRIIRLHRLALMRARADRRLVENFGVSPTSGWPSHAEVDEYRRSAIDF